MNYRFLSLLIVLSILLGGCSWMDGYHYSVTPHQEHSQSSREEDISASNYMELCTALEGLIQSGRESGVISVVDYDQAFVDVGMSMAVRYAQETYPIGAYAVESISYEIGKGGGKPAVAVEISYLRSYIDIQKICRVNDMDAAWTAISQALHTHSDGIVLLVEDYAATDIVQMIESYVQENPDKVMESPQVITGIYPESGSSRVVELKLTYQNSRDALRQMREQVQPLFTSAAMYVSTDAKEYVKFSQLYGFLMERFDYKLDTSITPAYSLLRHGVGDSKAFATVYTAMCRRAGLECQTVTGTRAGEPWYWNIVQDGGKYFHVDLLRSNAAGGFLEFLDKDMSGYVWDYSAYPACDVGHTPLEETTEATDSPKESIPEESTGAAGETEAVEKNEETETPEDTSAEEPTESTEPVST